VETEHGPGATPPAPAQARSSRGRARAKHLSRRTRRVLRSRWDILVVVAAGGALGAAARYGLGLAWPHRPGQFPAATFTVNVTGCLALGLLMVFVVEMWSGSRYLRPFLGVGVLGGYTTFSTYALETRDLLVAGHQQTAGTYLLGSLVAGLVAVWVGILTGRLALAIASRRAGTRARGKPPPRPDTDPPDASPPPSPRRRR
jgi:CrcB protein